MKQALAPRRQTSLATRAILEKLLTLPKVQTFIERAKKEIKPHRDRQVELGQRIAKLKINDQKSYDEAATLYNEIDRYREDTLELVQPLVQLTHTLWSGLTSVRKEVTDEADKNRTALVLKLEPWDRHVREENDRIAREAQKKADEEALRVRRQREEDQRRADEAAQKAQEEADAKRKAADEAAAKAAQTDDPAVRKEADKLQRQAQQAEARADQAEVVSNVATSVAQEPVEVQPVTTAPLFQEPANAPIWVDNWKGFSDDVMATVRWLFGLPTNAPIARPEHANLIIHDPQQLDTLAKAQKDLMNRIPGVHSKNERYAKQKGR